MTSPDIVFAFDFPADPAECIRQWRTAALRAEALQADYVASRAHAFLTPPEGEDKWTDGKREAYSRASTRDLLEAAQAAAIEATARKFWMTYVLDSHPGHSIVDWELKEASHGGE